MINHGEVEYWQERAIVAEYREKELRSLCSRLYGNLDAAVLFLKEHGYNCSRYTETLADFYQWRHDNEQG